MVLFFLLDLTCSLLLTGAFKVGSWVVCKSFNGLQYVYKRVRPEQLHQHEHDVYTLDELNSSHYIIITEEEYDSLKNNCKPKCVKRNVSSLTKKIIGSNQSWKCGVCNEIMDYAYEVDHHIPLFKGGSNDISNLIALCRNCHGKKTILENIDLS
jgi:5-methylcytosine-specific restriction endonuclease McrA